jgi:hypothetical protein
MKITKVYPHWKAYKNGFTHSIKFSHWNEAAREVENVATRLLGGEIYDLRYTPWRGEFGKRLARTDRFSGQYSYRIYFRNEAMITMILLAADQHNLKTA